MNVSEGLGGRFPVLVLLFVQVNLCLEAQFHFPNNKVEDEK